MPNNNRINNELYHYTSIDTLCAIIKSYNQDDETVELRATHIDFLNDANEGKVLDKLVEQIKDDKDININDGGNTIKLNDDEDIFITSFSKRRDDLNMWRNYAGTKGICLTFIRTRLDRLCYVNLEDKYKGLFDCEYPNMTPSNIKSIISNQSLTISYKHNGNKVKNLTPCYTKSIQAKYKHYGFIDEDEARIILSHDTKDIDFFTKKDIIKPYISYRVPVDCISEIWLAPENNAERTIKALELMFSKYDINHNITIIKSEHPYVSI